MVLSLELSCFAYDLSARFSLIVIVVVEASVLDVFSLYGLRGVELCHIVIIVARR